MIGQTERDYKGVEAQFMKKKILVLLVCSMLTLPQQFLRIFWIMRGQLMLISRMIRHRRPLRLIMEVERR